MSTFGADIFDNDEPNKPPASDSPGTPPESGSEEKAPSPAPPEDSSDAPAEPATEEKPKRKRKPRRKKAATTDDGDGAATATPESADDSTSAEVEPAGEDAAGDSSDDDGAPPARKKRKRTRKKRGATESTDAPESETRDESATAEGSSDAEAAGSDEGSDAPQQESGEERGSDDGDEEGEGRRRRKRRKRKKGGERDEKAQEAQERENRKRRDRDRSVAKDLPKGMVRWSPHEDPPIVPARSMGQRVAVFIDLDALLTTTPDGEGELSYRRMLRTLTGSRPTVRAVCYGGSPTARQLAASAGFELASAESDEARGVALAVDAMAVSPRVDCVVLAPQSAQLAPLVQALRGQGVRVETADFRRLDEGEHTRLGRDCLFVP